MTEVAAVSGHANATGKSGAATGGAAKGAGSVLDGAFAAIFGAAGGKSAEGTSVKPAAQAAPCAPTTDPALAGGASVEVDPQAVLADAEVKTDATAEPEQGTRPRKGSSQRKTDADQPGAQALALISSFASVVTASPQAPQGSQGPKKDIPAADGIQSVSAKAPIVTDVAIAANATVVAKPGTDSGKTDTSKPSKTVPVADSPTQAPGAPTNDLAQTDRKGDQAPDLADSRNGSGRDNDPAAAPKLAANDDTSPTAESLQDIMQSLPPVLQSQLSVAGVSGASTGPIASTSDQLNNQAIDMSVSGQWIDRMAREIATLASGTGHSSFQLSPPNLGKIQIDLMQSGDKTDVRILAETDEATRRLRDGQGALEANARMASLSLGSVSVEKTSASSDTRDQNSRQNPDSGATGQQQQQASTHAQNQSGQNRGGAGFNRGGFAAVMGQEQVADAESTAGTDQAGDPGVRFA